MKFPYGVRDFVKLITEDYLYLDRTDRIALMEQLGNELLFLRPRRMGKSLWLSTLMNYYDIHTAGKFEQLFGHLAVGKNPTPLRNKYMVMKWDFSNVQSHGSIEHIENSLNQHLNVQVEKFQLKYGTYLKHESRLYEGGMYSFDALLGAVQASGYQLYLFIDEYDNFANEVMMGRQGRNRDRYDDLLSGEGMFKTLFKQVKSSASGGGLDRVFMTGVSPIVMNDVTSGANTTEDISWAYGLNDLCGFREDEVLGLLSYLVHTSQFLSHQATQILDTMRIFYDGSNFRFRQVAENQISVTDNPEDRQYSLGIYNPTLAFYLLKHLQMYGNYPDTMLDSNLSPDYNKLIYISRFTEGRGLLEDAIKDNSSIQVRSMQERFGVADLQETHQQRERLAILLCYLGALTVDDTTATGQVRLKIPNLVMRRLYTERILELSFPEARERDISRSAADQLFTQGEIGPICQFIEQHYLNVYDNRDTRHFNELTIKTLFLALLQHNQLYIMDSEPALGRRYADLVMIIRSEMRHFEILDLLIEFKHISLATLKTSKISTKDIRSTNVDELLKLSPVQSAIEEAQKQLTEYRASLTQKYGNLLNLRTFVVIAVGMDRLLWIENQDK